MELILTAIVLSFWFLFPVGMFVVLTFLEQPKKGQPKILAN